MKKIAVFGLGAMGYGIASSALKAGFTTYGYDVADAQVSRFQSEGGAAGSVEQIAPDLDAVIVVVLNAAQTESVLFGEGGVVKQLNKGAVVLSCATVPPEFARQMEMRCAESGVHYLDAPISGGAAKAATGQLSVMAAGSPEAFTAAKPVLDAVAETVFTLGDSAGAGSAMKSVNQLLAGVHIATMAEALTFGMTQGVSPEKFVEVISKCAGTCLLYTSPSPRDS